MLFSPIAVAYLTIFVFLSALLTFTAGNFFILNEATLSYSFFRWHPLLYALLVPAIGMRSWTQEKSQGTLELLFAQPIGMSPIVLGKYAAACVLLLLGLALTFPLVATVIWLGKVDMGELISGYIGSALVAATFLGISCYFSALFRSQVIVYLLSTTLCVLSVLLGSTQLEGELVSIFPRSRLIVDFIGSLSINQYYVGFRRGLIELQSVVYFGGIICVSLLATAQHLTRRRL